MTPNFIFLSFIFLSLLLFDFLFFLCVLCVFVVKFLNNEG
jgi:hypothetical protein